MSSKNMLALVITTYNNPKYLELCLWSLTNQTFNDFEVFIADDGSGEETRELVTRMKAKCPFVIHHVWHPDEGYQKAKINNSVFRQIDSVRFPVTVCIDHDVILHPRFLEDHYLAHERAHFSPLMFMGRRVDLSEALSAEITPANVLDYTSGLNAQMLLSAFKKESKHVFRSIRVNFPDWLAHLLKRDRVYDLLGSNYSISTPSLFAVNGYNENFKSYWGEDGDLFVRVRNSGVTLKGRIGIAVQWHLFHKRLNETPEYVAAYQELLKDKKYRRCKNGIVKE